MSDEESIDLTADIHKLHLIRESPEYKIDALSSELAALQQRLTAANTTPTAPPE